MQPITPVPTSGSLTDIHETFLLNFTAHHSIITPLHCLHCTAPKLYLTSLFSLSSLHRPLLRHPPFLGTSTSSTFTSSAFIIYEVCELSTLAAISHLCLVSQTSSHPIITPLASITSRLYSFLRLRTILPITNHLAQSSFTPCLSSFLHQHPASPFYRSAPAFFQNHPTASL
jgi:hypothetical protein